MYLPSGVPRIVCGIFKQAIELMWYSVVDRHLVDGWNVLRGHLPFKVASDFRSNKVPRIMLRHNLFSHEKKHPIRHVIQLKSLD